MEYLGLLQRQQRGLSMQKRDDELAPLGRLSSQQQKTIEINMKLRYVMCVPPMSRMVNLLADTWTCTSLPPLPSPSFPFRREIGQKEGRIEEKKRKVCGWGDLGCTVLG